MSSGFVFTTVQDNPLRVFKVAVVDTVTFRLVVTTRGFYDDVLRIPPADLTKYFIKYAITDPDVGGTITDPDDAAFGAEESLSGWIQDGEFTYSAIKTLNTPGTIDDVDLTDPINFAISLRHTDDDTCKEGYPVNYVKATVEATTVLDGSTVSINVVNNVMTVDVASALPEIYWDWRGTKEYTFTFSAGGHADIVVNRTHEETCTRALASALNYTVTLSYVLYDYMGVGSDLALPEDTLIDQYTYPIPGPNLGSVWHPHTNNENDEWIVHLHTSLGPATSTITEVKYRQRGVDGEWENWSANLGLAAGVMNSSPILVGVGLLLDVNKTIPVADIPDTQFQVTYKYNALETKIIIESGSLASCLDDKRPLLKYEIAPDEDTGWYSDNTTTIEINLNTTDGDSIPRMGSYLVWKVYEVTDQFLQALRLLHEQLSHVTRDDVAKTIQELHSHEALPLGSLPEPDLTGSINSDTGSAVVHDVAGDQLADGYYVMLSWFQLNFQDCEYYSLPGAILIKKDVVESTLLALSGIERQSSDTFKFHLSVADASPIMPWDLSAKITSESNPLVEVTRYLGELAGYGSNVMEVYLTLEHDQAHEVIFDADTVGLDVWPDIETPIQVVVVPPRFESAHVLEAKLYTQGLAGNYSYHVEIRLDSAVLSDYINEVKYQLLNTAGVVTAEVDRSSVDGDGRFKLDIDDEVEGEFAPTDTTAAVRITVTSSHDDTWYQDYEDQAVSSIEIPLERAEAVPPPATTKFRLGQTYAESPTLIAAQVDTLGIECLQVIPAASGYWVSESYQYDGGIYKVWLEADESLPNAEGACIRYDVLMPGIEPQSIIPANRVTSEGVRILNLNSALMTEDRVVAEDTGHRFIDFPGTHPSALRVKVTMSRPTEGIGVPTLYSYRIYVSASKNLPYGLTPFRGGGVHRPKKPPTTD